MNEQEMLDLKWPHLKCQILNDLKLAVSESRYTL